MRTPTSLPQKAFTLIELLIVVAIIAILAAIAVPNFLEAQTRAKVARTVADIRSISVGLESYRVDNNSYPREYNTAGYNDPFIEPGVGVSSLLHPSVSTPIAYITNAWALDPFTGPNVNTFHQKRYFYQNLKHFEQNRLRGSGPQLSAGFTDLALGFYGEWRIGSVGPNASFRNPPLPDPAPTNSGQLPYDPTNGTLSDGNIWRSQARAENNMPPVGIQPPGCNNCLLLGEH